MPRRVNQQLTALCAASQNCVFIAFLSVQFCWCIKCTRSRRLPPQCQSVDKYTTYANPAYYENTLRSLVDDAVLLKKLAELHCRNLSQELMIAMREYIERHRKELKEK